MIVISALQAQEPLQESIDVTLVSIYVTALDSHGKFVSDLRADEIVLKEDGIIQPLSHFGAGEAEIPLTAGLVIDNSASMSSMYLEMAKKAGLRFLEEMKSQDSVFLVTFRRHPILTVDTTFEKSKIREALESLKVQYGSTAMFDAIKLAVEKLKPELGRKVLVIFSDGQDTVSNIRSPQDNPVSKFAGMSDIMTICFGTILSPTALRWYNAQKEYDQGKQTLENLAHVTGGFSFFPSNFSDVEKAMAIIRLALENQYAVSYQPSNPVTDGSWRTIEIICKRKGVTLGYRRGYFAANKEE